MTNTLINLPLYSVFTEPSKNCSINVEVKGLGIVSISRTDKGVVVDVYDNSQSDDSLNSLVFDECDFSAGFADELRREIEKFDPSISLDAQECLMAYKNNQRPSAFIAEYFDKIGFDLALLEPLKGVCKPFAEQVRELTAPYIAITESQHESLLAQPADFYMTKGGKVLTFGHANGGFALMTLQDEPARKVLASQSNLSMALSVHQLSAPVIQKANELGWHVWENNADYTDLEMDITYKDEVKGQHERLSLNALFTFDWHASSYRLVLGSNKGNGFDGEFTINFKSADFHIETESSVQRECDEIEMGAEESELFSIINHYPDAWQSLLGKIKELSVLMSMPPAKQLRGF